MIAVKSSQVQSDRDSRDVKSERRFTHYYIYFFVALIWFGLVLLACLMGWCDSLVLLHRLHPHNLSIKIVFKSEQASKKRVRSLKKKNRNMQNYNYTIEESR